MLAPSLNALENALLNDYGFNSWINKAIYTALTIVPNWSEANDLVILIRLKF